MRNRVRAAAFAALFVAGSLGQAYAEGPGVLACDSLMNLRLLMAAGDRTIAESALTGHPGCRAIPRDRIGAAEHRAMVGGAPFECLAVSGEGACLWVWP